MQPPSNPFGGLWGWLRSFPLALPTLLYALIFILATVFSVVPGISFWGSYQRGQGTYTNLSYIALFALIVATLRTRAQFDRLMTVLIFASLPVSGYGLIQHFQLDPLPWKGDVISRVASTMGNSIFVAAYLILVLPFVLYRMLANLAAARTASRENNGDAIWGVAYALLTAGTLALLLAIIKFGAVVRVPEPTFRYWWVFPVAIGVCTALWALVARGLPNAADRVPRGVFLAGALTLGFLIIFGIQFVLSQATGQQFDARQERGMDWGWWMLGGIVALGRVLRTGLPAAAPRRAAIARAAAYQRAGQRCGRRRCGGHDLLHPKPRPVAWRRRWRVRVLLAGAVAHGPLRRDAGPPGGTQAADGAGRLDRIGCGAGRLPARLQPVGHAHLRRVAQCALSRAHGSAA